MGNTSSRDKENEERRKYVSSKTRRQSNRSTMSTRFSSASMSSFTSSRNFTTDFEQQIKVQQQPLQQHHNLLDRIKHKGHKKNKNISHHQQSASSNSRFDNFSNTSLDDLQRSISPSSTLPYGSPHSANEVPLIEKYTDSQMTLLHNNSGYHSSQVDLTTDTSFYTISNSTIDTITSNNTSVTHCTNNYNNNNISENTEEIKQAYSSEHMLRELYMLCETSPERRRDRDRRHRQHYLSKRTWGSNYKIPLHNPTLIIDWCCATAVWDIELAFEFPNAQIIGIDYESATVSSLTNTVKNFSFQNAMIHQGKTGLESFSNDTVDYVMMRDVWLVNSPASKWTNILHQIYRILKPGGYVEIYEQDTNFKSMGPNLTILENWSDRFYEAIKLNRNTNNELDTFLCDAGFVNIQQESKELPLGEWPLDRESKETGYLQKDLTERRFRESKRWYCKFNNLSEKEYTNTLIKAIDECDHYNTSVRSLYYSAQKPIES